MVLPRTLGSQIDPLFVDADVFAGMKGSRWGRRLPWLAAAAWRPADSCSGGGVVLGGLLIALVSALCQQQQCRHSGLLILLLFLFLLMRRSFTAGMVPELWAHTAPVAAVLQAGVTSHQSVRPPTVAASVNLCIESVYCRAPLILLCMAPCACVGRGCLCIYAAGGSCWAMCVDDLLPLCPPVTP